MSVYTPKPKLEHVLVDRVRPNPDNPRIAFRQSELDELQESIRVYGVQVPIAVYTEGNHYVLIDGERRWRCASKLNMTRIPALVQDKPTALENLLLMFNIHSLREQWDLLTIAMKLPKVIEQMKQENERQPTEADLSSATGLNRSTIRRSRLLMDMPNKYKKMLLDELKRPKARQRLSEDLFIEMERSLKTVERSLPGVLEDDKNAARDSLIAKYLGGVINNIVDFRKIGKIARAEKVGGDPVAAEKALQRLIGDNRYTIEQAFNDTVSGFYAERDIVTRIEALIERLEQAPEEAIDEDVREKLEELVEHARKMLEAHR